MSEIKPGNIVRLKSGGPHMTIAFQADGSTFRCI